MTTEATKPAAGSGTDVELADTQPAVRLGTHLRPITHAQRVALFGRFAFTPDPQPGNPEHVVIAEPWARDHLVTVVVPQLQKSARVHVLIEKQFLALWAAWESAGLLGRVLAFNGAWASRFKRGKAGGDEQDLSNHAWGTAFDINAAYNPLGHTPALVGHKGCVRELVPIAAQFGFFWGGDFLSRPDGMHFEAAQVLP